MDESTKREIEQIGLIMELKVASAKAGKSGADDDEESEDCETCNAYE